MAKPRKGKILIKASMMPMPDDMQTPDMQHPNKMPIMGELFYIDRPSDYPPEGAGGFCILFTKEVAQKMLPSMVGMGLNASLDGDGDGEDGGLFSDHDPRSKIGIITRTWTDGNLAKYEGYLFAYDFPDVCKMVKACQGDLGCSIETDDQTMMDFVEMNDDIVARCLGGNFTGAAILFKDSAAYQNLKIAASRERGDNMKEVLEALKKMQEEMTASLTAHVDSKVGEAVTQFEAKIADVTKVVGEIQAKGAVELPKDFIEKVDALVTTVAEIKATGITPPGQKRKTIPAGGLLAKYGAKDDANVVEFIDNLKGIDTTTKIAMKLEARKAGLLDTKTE